MPSFLIRGLAKYFAASKMASSSSSSTTPDIDEVAEGVVAWNNNLRWLIPFVQASGYRIEIENPKSHEKIIIDTDTKDFPFLTSSWMRKYDKNDLDKWLTREKEKENARLVAEARGRAKFGESFTPTEKDIQDAINSR